MSKTRIRPNLQITNSRVYDDTVAAGSTMESGTTYLEDDLNSLRSQVLRLLGQTNWYDDIGTVNSKQRDVLDLNTDLDELEEQRILCPVQVLTDVAVGGTDNFVVLSVAGSEAPSDTAAVGAGTALGAIVALLPGASGTHSLNEVAGANALSPKNLLHIRDASTKDPITSGGQQIYGLLQAESIVVDGDAFDDTTKQAQISFVIQSGDDLIACPAADIQGKTIEYMYSKRVTLDTLPEDCNFPNVQFSDQTAAVDVTRQVAYNNQGTTAVDLTTNATLDLETAGISWKIRDDLEADLLAVTEGSAGGTSDVTVAAGVDTFNVDAVDNDFANGVKMDTGSASPIHVGVTDGHVESSAGDLHVQSAAEIYFDDVNQTGSTWAQTDGVKLSETTAEWDDYETAFGGEVSLLNAIVQAFNNGGGLTRSKTVAVVTSNVAADVNVTGAGGTPNIDAQLGDYSAVTFTTDVDIWLNGNLLRNGADAAANHDVYPGTTPANGDLKFEFGLEASPGNPDTIAMVVWS